MAGTRSQKIWEELEAARPEPRRKKSEPKETKPEPKGKKFEQNETRLKLKGKEFESMETKFEPKEAKSEPKETKLEPKGKQTEATEKPFEFNEKKSETEETTSELKEESKEKEKDNAEGRFNQTTSRSHRCDAVGKLPSGGVGTDSTAAAGFDLGSVTSPTNTPGDKVGVLGGLLSRPKDGELTVLQAYSSVAGFNDSTRHLPSLANEVPKRPADTEPTFGDSSKPAEVSKGGSDEHPERYTQEVEDITELHAEPGGSTLPQPNSRQTDIGNAHDASVAPTVTAIDVFVKDLRPERDSWRVCARVVACGPVCKWSNAQTSGTLMEVYLVDAKEALIRATFFNEAIQQFAGIVTPGALCTFEGGKIKYSARTCRPPLSKFELTFNDTAHIAQARGSKIPDDLQILQLRSIEEVGTVATRSAVSTSGVIFTVSAPKRLITAKGRDTVKREVTIVDESRHKVVCTIWGQMANCDIEEYEGLPQLRLWTVLPKLGMSKCLNGYSAIDTRGAQLSP